MVFSVLILVIDGVAGYQGGPGVRVVQGDHHAGGYVDTADRQAFQVRLGGGSTLGVHGKVGRIHLPVADNCRVVQCPVPGDTRVQSDGNQTHAGRNGVRLRKGIFAVGVGAHGGVRRFDGALVDFRPVLRLHIGVVHADAGGDSAQLRRGQLAVGPAGQVAGHGDIVGRHICPLQGCLGLRVVEGEQHVTADGDGAGVQGQHPGLRRAGDIVGDIQVIGHDHGVGHLVGILDLGPVFYRCQGTYVGVNVGGHVAHRGVQAHRTRADADAQQVGIGGGGGVAGHVQCAGLDLHAFGNAGFLLQAVDSQGHAGVHADLAGRGGHRHGVRVDHRFAGDIYFRGCFDVVLPFRGAVRRDEGGRLAVGLGRGNRRAHRHQAADAQGTGSCEDRFVVLFRVDVHTAGVADPAAQDGAGHVVGISHGHADRHAGGAAAGTGQGKHADTAVADLVPQLLVVVHALPDRLVTVCRGVVALILAGVKAAALGVGFDVDCLSILNLAQAGCHYVAVQDRHRGADTHTGGTADRQGCADQVNGHRLFSDNVHALRFHRSLLSNPRDHCVGRQGLIAVAVDALGVFDVLGVLGLQVFAAAFLLQVGIVPFLVFVVLVLLGLPVVVKVAAAVAGGTVEGGSVLLLGILFLMADILLALVVAVACQVFIQHRGHGLPLDGIALRVLFDVAVFVGFIFVVVVPGGAVIVLVGVVHELRGIETGLVVLVLLAAVAVHDHVGSVLAHGRAGHQDHDSDAYAGDAAAGCVDGRIDHVALAGSFHIHRSAGIRGAAQFSDRVALHHTDDGVHADARGAADGNGAGSGPEDVIAAGTDIQVFLCFQGSAFRGRCHVGIPAHQYVRRAGDAGASAGGCAHGVDIDVLVGGRADFGIHRLDIGTGFQVRLRFALEVSHRRHGADCRGGTGGYSRRDIVQVRVIVGLQGELAFRGRDFASDFRNGLAAEYLYRDTGLYRRAAGAEARAQSQLAEIVMVLCGDGHVALCGHIVGQGLHVLVGHDGNHRSAGAQAGTGADTAGQQHLLRVVVRADRNVGGVKVAQRDITGVVHVNGIQLAVNPVLDVVFLSPLQFLHDAQELLHRVGTGSVCFVFHLVRTLPLDVYLVVLPVVFSQRRFRCVRLHLIVVYQGNDNAVNGERTRGNADAGAADILGFLGVRADVDAVGLLTGMGQGLRAACTGPGYGGVIQAGVDLVVLDDGQHGRTDSRAAAHRDTARRVHGVVGIVGFDHGIFKGCSRNVVAEGGIDPVLFNHHADISGYRRVAGGTCCGQSRDNVRVLAVGLYPQILCGSHGAALIHRHVGAAVQHVHVERAADAHTGSQSAGQGGVQQPVIVIGGDGQIAFLGLDCGVLADLGIRGGTGYDHVYHARNSLSLVGRCGGQGGCTGNQLIGNVGGDLHTLPRFRVELVARRHFSSRLVHNHVDRTAHRGAAAAQFDGGAAGDRHQVVVCFAGKLHLAAGGIRRVVSDNILRNGLVDDDIDRAACRSTGGLIPRRPASAGCILGLVLLAAFVLAFASVAGRNSCGDGKHLLVAGGLRVAGDTALRVDGPVVAGFVRDFVAVHHHGDSDAHTGFTRNGYGAGDDPGSIAVGGVQGHVSIVGVDFDIPSHRRVYTVFAHRHGKGAGQGGFGAD